MTRKRIPRCWSYGQRLETDLAWDWLFTAVIFTYLFVMQQHVFFFGRDWLLQSREPRALSVELYSGALHKWSIEVYHLALRVRLLSARGYYHKVILSLQPKTTI